MFPRDSRSVARIVPNNPKHPTGRPSDRRITAAVVGGGPARQLSTESWSRSGRSGALSGQGSQVVKPIDR